MCTFLTLHLLLPLLCMMSFSKFNGIKRLYYFNDDKYCYLKCKILNKKLEFLKFKLIVRNS